MKQKHLKLLTLCSIAIVAFCLISSKKSSPVKTANHLPESPNNFSRAEVANSNDYLRAVSARLNQSDKEVQQLASTLKALQGENKQLKHALANVDKPPTRDLLALNKTIHALEKKVSSLSKSKHTQSDAIALKGEEYSVQSQTSKPIQYVVDLEEGQPELLFKKDEKTYWQKNEKENTKASGPRAARTSSSRDKKGIPYYTLPAGSDLTSATLLSALIGEVPVDSKLAQPLFPFSAVIGRGSLMAANGVPLPPDIRGMKVSGYAIGVGSFLDNISCARAYVTQALFVFQDGHFEVVGEERMRNATDMVDNQALGYLTTAFGNPCIPGTYHTNAPMVLAALTGAAGVSGAGKALSQFQVSYFAGSGGVAGVPTGSIGKYALGEGLSSGSVKAAEWLEHRIKGSFDMVFVPASIPVRHPNNQITFCPNRLTLHLTKTIEINKDLNARRISYGKDNHARFDNDFK